MFNIFKKQQQKTVTNDAILSLKYTPSQDVEELATIILASTNTCVVHHSQKIKIQKNLKSLSIISNGGSNRGLPGQTSKYVVDYEWADETTTSIQVALLDLAKFYRKHKVKTVFAFDTDHQHHSALRAEGKDTPTAQTSAARVYVRWCCSVHVLLYGAFYWTTITILGESGLWRQLQRLG